METSLYVNPSKEICFIAHPRTASTSIRECLLKARWRQVGTHHQIVPSAINGQMIVCSVVREPFDWFSSWYFYETDARVGFDEWLDGFLRRGGHHVGAAPFLHPNDCFFGLEYTDWVLLYTHLQAGLDYICNRFHMDKFELPLHQRRNYGKVNAFTSAGAEKLYRERGVLIAQYNRFLDDLDLEHKIVFGGKK